MYYFVKKCYLKNIYNNSTFFDKKEGSYERKILSKNVVCSIDVVFNFPTWVNINVGK